MKLWFSLDLVNYQIDNSYDYTSKLEKNVSNVHINIEKSKNEWKCDRFIIKRYSL